MPSSPTYPHTAGIMTVQSMSLCISDICVAVIEEDGGYEAAPDEQKANAHRLALAWNALPILERLMEAIATTKTSESGNRVWMDTRDWCGSIKGLAEEARTALHNANAL